MALTMTQRKAVTKELAQRYTSARKKEKGKILDDLIDLTGNNRSYAATVLRQAATTKKKTIGRGRKSVTLVEDRRMKRLKRRKRPRKYDEAVLKSLKKIWTICDCICSKRLAPYLSEIIPVLEKFDEIELDPEVREKLLQISAATIDRLLAPVKREYQLKARSNTKPGTLLKHQILIMICFGICYLEMSLLTIRFLSQHNVPLLGDIYRNPCNLLCSFMLGSHRWSPPPPLLLTGQIEDGTTNDGCLFHMYYGGEFINHHLFKYCVENNITFTQGRSYKKNDGCFVEQKNYSMVRRAVGYGRHDTD